MTHLKLSTSCINLTLLDSPPPLTPNSPLSRTNSSNDSGIQRGRISTLSTSDLIKIKSLSTGMLSNRWSCPTPSLREQMNATSLFAGIAEHHEKNSARLNDENTDLKHRLDLQSNIIRAQDKTIEALKQENSDLEIENQHLRNTIHHTTRLRQCWEAKDQSIQRVIEAQDIANAQLASALSRSQSYQVNGDSFKIGGQVTLKDNPSAEGNIISLNAAKNTAWVSFEPGTAHEILLSNLTPIALV